MSVEISKLDNGIHVVTDSMPTLETASLGVWFMAGARDETETQNGIAHFLEHMAFKGTRRRSALQIAEEIENVGGEINAATSMETTSYFARVLAGDWRLALDILADILTDPVFDHAEIERERAVILQEIAAANDAPDDLVFERAQALCYPDHALGRPILGTPERIATFEPADIATYRRAHYTGQRMVIGAAGKIDHRQVVEAAAESFHTIEAGDGTCWSAPAFVAGSAFTERPVEQTHLVLSLPAFGYRDENIYVLHALSGLLGGGMSSRLFQELREKRGLCYSVFSFASAYSDSGNLSVYAATAPDKAKQLLQLITEQFSALAGTSGARDQEVARAKAQIKAGLVMCLENPTARADQIARQFLAFGQVPEMSEMLGKVDAVDMPRVTSLAEQLFSTSERSLAAVGDLSGLGELAG